jgi:hypothetical protein
MSLSMVYVSSAANEGAAVATTLRRSERRVCTFLRLEPFAIAAPTNITMRSATSALMAHFRSEYVHAMALSYWTRERRGGEGEG